MKDGFPHKVIENTINNFNNVDKELMIPGWLFDERKTVAINLHFSNKNEQLELELEPEVRVLYKQKSKI